MRVHQERETEAQEPMSEVPRGRLEAEIARLREEIMALRLENQIRHMKQDIVVCLHHHTGESRSNVSHSADLVMCDLRMDGEVRSAFRSFSKKMGII